MRNNLFPIAKEGWGFILYSALAFVLFSVIDLEFLAFIAFVFTVFFLFVYRNPERQLPTFEELSVVSPVDGIVLSIEEMDDNLPYAYKVEIDTGYTDVSVLRIPFTSSVKKFSILRGARVSRLNTLSKKLNENSEIIFENKNKNKIKIVHMLKQSFDGIKIDVLEEQKFQQGSRYGVIVNGVTTIYLPQNFRLNINVGNQIKGSESLIGYFS